MTWRDALVAVGVKRQAEMDEGKDGLEGLTILMTPDAEEGLDGLVHDVWEHAGIASDAVALLYGLLRDKATSLLPQLGVATLRRGLVFRSIIVDLSAECVPDEAVGGKTFETGVLRRLGEKDLYWYMDHKILYGLGVEGPIQGP